LGPLERANLNIFQYLNIYTLLDFLFDADVVERATIAFISLVQFEK
jgi:hypothetical protein